MGVERIQKLREEIERANKDMERAQQDYDLNRAAELLPAPFYLRR